jgi:Secretion system C-terminal sorting domain
MKILLLLFLILSFTALSFFAQAEPLKVNNAIEKVSPRLNNKLTKLSQSLAGEFILDTNSVRTVEPNDQNYPSVAFDGTNYFVVWDDQRGSDKDIYGTRVSANGTILDRNGIIISAATNHQEYPTVSFDGTNYFVVWQDYRSGYNNYDIYGARVTTAGTVLDTDGIVISAAVENQEFPSVMWSGSNYLVVWQDERNGNLDIYGSRVTQSGIVLDPASIAISTANNAQTAPSLAFDNNNFLVVWQDARNSGILYPDIYGARVNQSGLVIDSTSIAISAASNRQSEPSIAFDGTNYLVVWEDGRNDDLLGSRVSSAGAVLDTNGIAISTANNIQNYPSVAFDGNNYLVVWQDYRNNPDTSDIYGSRVDPNGVVIDTSGIAISTAASNQENPAIGFGNTGFVAVWTDERNGSNNFDIYGTRISPEGTIIDPSGFAISVIANFYNQSMASVSCDGTNYLAVWTDEQPANKDILGIRINQTSVILDSLPIPISISPGNQYSPSVAFDGINYFVTWTDERNLPTSYADIYGARVSQSGIVLDPDGIIISAAPYDQQLPSIAFDGNDYLIAWQDRRNGLDNSDIYGARVTQAGTVLDPNGLVISDTTDDQEVPAIAFGGANYLVAWEDERNAYRDIYGTRVSTTGAVLDPAGIAISNGSNYQESTAVAFDGTNYLVAWQDRRNTSHDIYGSRMSQDGFLLDTLGIAICNANENQNRPDVAYDGTHYFVVWQDYRSASSWDIYGAKLNPAGSLVDSLVVSTQDGNLLGPKVAHGSSDRFLVVYSGWTDSINHLPANSMRIWGKIYPTPGIGESTQPLSANSLPLEIYPNPFNSQTAIRFSLSVQNQFSLKIYNISGKLVKSFNANNHKLTTKNFFTWSGTDNSGKKLPAGVYIARLKTNYNTETKEFVILR